MLSQNLRRATSRQSTFLKIREDPSVGLLASKRSRRSCDDTLSSAASRAPLGSGARSGFRRVEHPSDDCSSPGLVTPIPRHPDTFCRKRVARTAGGAVVAGCALAHPTRHAYAHLAGTLPRTISALTGRTRLRELHPPVIPLAQDLPAGVRPRFSREGSRGPRHPRCLPSWAACHRDDDLHGKPREPPGAPAKVGVCSQVVPSLWTNRRRLFNPCRLNPC